MNRNPTFINWCANIRAKNIAKSLPHPHPSSANGKIFKGNRDMVSVNKI